jgi:pantoate kinase
VTKALLDGLESLGDLLALGPLKIAVQKATPDFMKLEVLSKDDRTLFTVDLGGIASVIASGVEEHLLEAVSSNSKALVRSVSRDHLLLQNAKAFAFRRGVKVRDVYDIKLLLDSGAALSAELQYHLADALAMREVGPDDLAARIKEVTPGLCRSQPRDVLPSLEYKDLEQAQFRPLHVALRKLFQKWL